jgi:4-diphosphocytidyl-2-C-methyl-D-erythritol kinase
MTASASSTDPLRRLTPIVRLAPAKLNLTLAVVGRRDDGFHELHSVMVPLELADRLSVAVAPSAVADSLHRDGFDAGPVASDLVIRAFAAARSAVGAGWAGVGAPPPLAARLEKRIPVAAGLGGGSSDAAAALDAAVEAWGAELDPATRLRVAARLGSDVPFFLAGGPALIEGRGEHVTPLPWLRDGPPPGVLLVTPAIAVPTPDVFAAYAGGARVIGGAARLASEHLASELRGGLRAHDFLVRAGVLTAANDLAAAADAVLPELVAFRRALRRVTGRPIGLSGSGPTHWALYPSSTEAEEAAAAVREAVGDGRLPTPGGSAPFVTATTIRPPGGGEAGSSAGDGGRPG